MNYLNRPIFPIEIDWSENPARSFSYNLRELQIGFGALNVAPLQQEVLHGLQFSLALKVDELLALDAFVADRQHGLKGFWLPAESEVFTMESDLANGVCVIRNQSLASTWQTLPALYVWFEPDGAAAFAARVTGVEPVDAATERVTLDDASLNCAACAVRRLLYVRFAGDVEEAQFIAEGYATRKVRVIELPLEYAQAETGQRPVFLFDFAFVFPSATQHWRYTSFLDSVTISGATFAPYPITYKSLRRSAKIEQTTCTVQTILDPAGPFELYASGASDLPIAVTISKTTLPGLATPTVIFAGEITEIRLTGRVIDATVSNFVAAFSRRLPRMTVQKRCNWVLFDADTCGLSRSTYAKTATVGSATGADMQLSAAGLGAAFTGYYAQGTLQVGAGDSAQIRRILYDSSVDANTRRIILDRALTDPAGRTVTILPGCDRSQATCANKFGNFNNFGGQPFVPARNLSMNITTNAQGGAKK
ncbi:MAG: phage BR0599 family protein [Verrucomicrobia bacterium]|nr:phage BR0599 family protein [Verrucomicrobiota bacterium]